MTLKRHSQLAITCSKLIIETLEQGVKYVDARRRSGVFIVNFEHISHLVLELFSLVATQRPIQNPVEHLRWSFSENS